MKYDIKKIIYNKEDLDLLKKSHFDFEEYWKQYTSEEKDILHFLDYLFDKDVLIYDDEDVKQIDLFKKFLIAFNECYKTNLTYEQILEYLKANH